MKTSGPSGLAKPRGPGAPCRRRFSALQDRDEDVRHRSHSRSQRDGRTPIATAGRPAHGDRSCRSAHRRARRLPARSIQVRRQVRFSAAHHQQARHADRLPPFSRGSRLVQAQRRAREAVVVHPGSSRDGAGARVGSGCVVLHRSGGSSSSERHPETRAASDASARRSHAICDNLVLAGRLAADRVCRLAARPYACPFLMSASGGRAEVTRAASARLPWPLAPDSHRGAIMRGRFAIPVHDRSCRLLAYCGRTVHAPPSA